MHYQIKTLFQIKYEDIPKVVHPYLLSAYYQKTRLMSRLDDYDILLVEQLPFHDGVLDPSGNIRYDVDFTLRGHLNYLIKQHQLGENKVRQVGGAYRPVEEPPKPTKTEKEQADTKENRKRDAYQAMVAPQGGNPSYGNDERFVEGYVKHSENRDLSGVLSLTPAASVVDGINAGKEFVANPSLATAAMVAAAAIPGKWVDKAIDAIPIKRILEKSKKKKKIVKPVVKEKAGIKDNWNETLNNPKPNTIYEVECIHNGKKAMYTYETDGLGRTISVKGKLELSPLKHKERNKVHRDGKGQIKNGGAIARSEGKREAYDGGHAVAAVFMGPAEKINIVPQLKSLNRGKDSEWANMERDWKKSLKDNQSVDVEIKFAYDGDSKVPSEIFGKHKINSGDFNTFEFFN